MPRSYSELSQLETYEERFAYLSLGARVGDITFGHERRHNQEFYHSVQWKRARRLVILRDHSCDLGIRGYDIHAGLHVHHMNPMSMADLENSNGSNLDPEFLITVTQATHNAIHYGAKSHLPRGLVERRPGDTVPWARKD